MASSGEGSKPSSNHPSISNQKSVHVKSSLNCSLVSSAIASDVTSLLFRKTSSTESPSKLAPTKPTTLPQKKLEDVILSQSLALTDHIFGLYAFELWHYREATGTLVIVPLNDTADEESGKVYDGLYVKRIPQEVDPNNDYSSKEAITAFARLTERSRSDYIHPIPTGPGVGLPGVLWSETSNGANTSGSARNLDRSQRSARSLASQTNQRGGNNMSLVAAFTKGTCDSVAWRHVDALANDPDQVSLFFRINDFCLLLRSFF